jgi:hypothetical protein
VTPSRVPVSISCFLTQSCKVCGTQPIFGAMDSIAAHNDGYSHGAPAPCGQRVRAPRGNTWGWSSCSSCPLNY